MGRELAMVDESGARLPVWPQGSVCSGNDISAVGRVSPALAEAFRAWAQDAFGTLEWVEVIRPASDGDPWRLVFGAGPRDDSGRCQPVWKSETEVAFAYRVEEVPAPAMAPPWWPRSTGDW